MFAVRLCVETAPRRLLRPWFPQACLMVLAVLCSPAIATAQVAALFDASEKDFGNVPYGSVNVHRFTARNTTAATLHVASVRSSCHCATPTIIADTARPGESIVIEVKYDARKFTGPRSMTISADFDQPTWETVNFRISGYSRTDIQFNPGEVLFGSVRKGKEARRTVSIDFSGNDAWKIDRLATVSGANWLDARVQEISRAGGQVRYELTVVLAASAPIGQHNEFIRLWTNDGVSPVVDLFVNATVEGAVTPSQSVVELGTLKLGEKASKRFLLKGDNRFRIKSVDDLADGMGVQSTEGERTVHVVAVDFEAKTKGAVDRQITLRTDHPEEPAVTVRVVARVEGN